jgi:CheY-like chemotaxis protein
MKVLLIDDNPDTRYLTGRILKQLGCDVVQFPTATHALSLLNVSNPFDVIFTDLHMPGMDGIEFIEAVKIHHSNAFIVAISSSPHPQLQERAISKGASYCIFENHDKVTYKAALDTAQSPQLQK